MLRSIKAKILSIYIFLIFLISFIAIISILNLYSLNKAIDGLIASNYKSIVAATYMIDAVERQDSNELIYLEVDRDKGVRAFNDNQREFYTWLSRAKDNITEAGEDEIIQRISRDYSRYVDYFSKLQEIKNTRSPGEATVFYDNEISPIFHSVKSSCRELLTLNETAMFNSKEKANVNSKNQMYGTIVISALSILLGLTVAFYFTRKIVDPIYMLISGARSIQEGNLSQRIDVSTKDEIGELASEFNSMTMRLSQYEKSNIKNLIFEKNKSLAIVKSISDPIIVTDNDFRITLVNKSAENILDISESEVVGRHFLESINNRNIFKEIKDVIDGKENNDHTDIITLMVSNKPRHFMITVTSILNDDNNINGTVTVLQDITHLKEVEQIKSDFVTTASHELRTPLTSIIMGTRLLLDNVSGDLNDDQKEIVQAIDEDGNQLMSLVNDLLDLSRIESGRMQMDFRRTSIYDVIEACVRPLLDIAENRGIVLFHEVPQDLPPVYIDSNKIKYILNNLITNALKFTDSGGVIKISARTEGDTMKVSVKDTGIGIPEEYHSAIFDKFTQVKSSANKGGSGLGLAIAKEYIKKHDGDIWVESEPGHGSNFVFTLPLYRG